MNRSAAGGSFAGTVLLANCARQLQGNRLAERLPQPWPIVLFRSWANTFSGILHRMRNGLHGAERTAVVLRQ